MAAGEGGDFARTEAGAGGEGDGDFVVPEGVEPGAGRVGAGVGSGLFGVRGEAVGAEQGLGETGGEPACEAGQPDAADFHDRLRPSSRGKRPGILPTGRADCSRAGGLREGRFWWTTKATVLRAVLFHHQGTKAPRKGRFKGGFCWPGCAYNAWRSVSTSGGNLTISATGRCRQESWAHPLALWFGPACEGMGFKGIGVTAAWQLPKCGLASAISNHPHDLC